MTEEHPLCNIILSAPIPCSLCSHNITKMHYFQGGAVVGMIQDFLGLQTFRRAMQVSIRVNNINYWPRFHQVGDNTILLL